jgi:hypothetical protein
MAIFDYLLVYAGSRSFFEQCFNDGECLEVMPVAENLKRE